ncbi:hypothetical protein JCM24511_00694 [Saitozyma sp. JCM 24511]|nr:hypothetical protein JCM24511_00694 [Saitozyma sp. JCM 24511]
MSGFAQLAQILADPEAYNMTYTQAFETVAEAIIVPSKAIYLGPHIMGLLLGAFQYGIVVVLFCVWVYHFAKTDSWLVRLVVVWLFVFATVAIGHVAAWTLHLFVYNFGSYSPFIINDYSMWFYIIDMLIRTPVSGFFAHRAFRLAGRSKASYLLLAVIGACMGLSAAGSIGVKIIVPHDYITLRHTVRHRASGQTQPDLRLLLRPWFLTHSHLVLLMLTGWQYAGAMAAGVIITVTIALCLMRTRTGWSDTDRMINRILYLTVETQLPPTCLAIGFIIIYSHDNTSPLQAFFVAASQTYVTTFLAVLVTRLKRTSRSGNSTTDNSYKNASLPQHATVQITTDVYEEKHAYDSRAFKKSINRDELHPEHTLVNSDSESSQEYYPASNSSKVGLTQPASNSSLRSAAAAS